MIIVTTDAGNSEHRGLISEQGKFGNSEHRGNSEHILIPRPSEIISAGAEKTAWHLLLTCAETFPKSTGMESDTPVYNL